MHDAAAIFVDLWKMHLLVSAPRLQRLLPDGCPHNTLAPLIATFAPVQENAGFFEPLPPRGRPPKSSWRWIIRVLWLHPDAAGESYARRSVFFGAVTEDLVACSPDLLRVTSRLNGLADVIGYPVDPSLAEDAPIRIFSTPLAWMRAGCCTGVVPVGADAGVQHYLRGCRAGVSAEGVPHGEALLKKMKREHPALPRVFVASS